MGASDLAFEAGEYYRSGDYNNTITSARAALDAADATPADKDRAWQTIARSHLAQGAWEQADGAAEQIASADMRADYAHFRARYASAAHDTIRQAAQAANSGDTAEAIRLYEEALRVEGLDDDVRLEIYRILSLNYLTLGEWGRAEEYHVAAGSPDEEDYQRRRAAKMQAAGVKADDIAYYDGSQYDDAFQRARDLYIAGDYDRALQEIQPIVDPTIGRDGFGEEVWLYVAMIYLRKGERGWADGYSAFLTGTWLDAYNEEVAKVEAGH